MTSLSRRFPPRDYRCGITVIYYAEDSETANEQDAQAVRIVEVDSSGKVVRNQYRVIPGRRRRS